MSPDVFSSIASTTQQVKPGSDASLVTSSMAKGAALGSTIPIPVVGTVFGAVIGTALGLFQASKRTTHDGKLITINGLKYYELTPKDSNRLKIQVLTDGHKGALEKLGAVTFALPMISRAEKNPQSLISYAFPPDIIASVEKKGFDFNQINRIIITLPDGTIYAIRGNGVFTNVALQQVGSGSGGYSTYEVIEPNQPDKKVLAGISIAVGIVIILIVLGTILKR